MTYDEIETFLIDYNKVLAAMEFACRQKGLIFDSARYAGSGIVEVTGTIWPPETETFDLNTIDLHDIINRDDP